VRDGGLDGIDGRAPHPPLVVAVEADLLGELGRSGVLGVVGGGLDVELRDALRRGRHLVLDDRPDEVVGVADLVRRLAAPRGRRDRRLLVEVLLVVDPPEGVAALEAHAQAALGGVALHDLPAAAHLALDLRRDGQQPRRDVCVLSR
jgi:hypothetical protein